MASDYQEGQRLFADKDYSVNAQFFQVFHFLFLILTWHVLNVEFVDLSCLSPIPTPLPQDMFELARRFKISNPDKMRGEYGKLVYLLQDASIPQVRHLLMSRPPHVKLTHFSP